MTTAAARVQAGSRGPAAVTRADAAVYLLLAAAAAILWWACGKVPDSLPVWAPWDFAPVQFLSAWLALWWYARGVAAAAPSERPPLWRSACFFVGLAITYAVLLTHFEYLAEHMFFLNRAQHIAMHHLGPMLIVLGWPGAALKRGMPEPLARVVESRWVRRPVHIIQQPLLAAVLFVGLVYLWLIPSVHFRAMIDPDLYAVMNWSMVVDGILFWSLILDPRPSPPARMSYLARTGFAIGVMFPQIVLGAVITFDSKDLYGFYHWCGRIYPNIGAARDQMLGGLIVWIPAAMMSVVALLLVLNFMRQGEKQAVAEGGQAGQGAIDASSWTGN